MCGYICPPDDLNDLVNDLHRSLSSSLDAHAPLRSRSIPNRTPVPWFNDKVKKAKIERRKKEKIWRKTQSYEDRKEFCIARNKVSSVLYEAKTDYYQIQIVNCDGDQRKIFKIITELNPRKSIRNLPSGSTEGLLKVFSDFFVQKIEKIRQAILESIPPNLDQAYMPKHQLFTTLEAFKPATKEEIEKIIKTSKSTSCPLDALPTTLLKKCLSVLLPVITQIINVSLSSGKFPRSFSHALVKPLLKKPNVDCEILKNYRPVSNLSFLSKILEKVVACRLSTYMSENGLHENMQSAYKIAHSTESALIRVQNDILCQLDMKKGVILVLLDLSAAFDTIDHNHLFELLQKRFSIQGTALNWIKSYLENRSFSIHINGKTSSPTVTSFGVPQGSVLGPILFTIYTTPLADIIKHHNLSYHFYADDTQLYITFDPKSKSSLQESIASIEKCAMDIKIWMSQKMLKLNDDKTEVLYITSPYFKKSLSTPNLNIDQSRITATTSARNIGVIFDDCVQLKEHIKSVCRASHFHLRNIGSIRCYLTPEMCAALVHSLISSKLDYCNSLLIELPASQINRLQRIQNSAARIVSRLPSHEHITPVLKNLHWLPVQQRIKFKVVLFVFKCFNGLAPPYLSELIAVKENLCTCTLRSDGGLLERKTSNKFGDRAFSVCGPVLWNQLPPYMKKIKSLVRFKKELKTHLFNEAFG